MLTVKEYFSEACTTAGISNLSTCKNAKDAMKEFCKSQFYAGEDRYKNRVNTTLTAIYVFTAGPEYSEYPFGAYGTEFAAFILENGLGEIATLPARLNARYHPSSKCQTWLWAPNQKAMEAWWKENKDK